MTRVSHGVASHKRHKKLFRATKGYRGKHRYTIKLASNAFTKAGQHAYRHRKQKKREFHQLWVLRINAACREHGIKYSRFIYGLDLAGIVINRKMLSELAIHEPAIFKQIVEEVKAIMPAPGKAPELEKLRKHYEAHAHAVSKPAAKAPKAEAKVEKKAEAAPAKKPAAKKAAPKAK